MKQTFGTQNKAFAVLMLFFCTTISLLAQDKVGINTSNAELTHKLTITDTTTSLLRLIGPGIDGEPFFGQGAKIEFGDLLDRVYISEDLDDKLNLYGLSRLSLMSAGNIGVHTKDPLEKFHINGNTLIRRQTGDALLTIEADSSNNNEFANPQILFKQDGGTTNAMIGFDEDSLGQNNFGISMWNKTGVMRINGDGNFGINSPPLGNYTFTIKGTPGDLILLRTQSTSGSPVFQAGNDGNVGINQWFSDVSLNVRGIAEDYAIFNAEDEAGSNKFQVQRDGEVYIQNELGIGLNAPTEEVHVRASDPTILLQSNGNSEPSGRVSLRQINSTGFDIFYDGGPDKLVFEGFSGTTSQGQHMTIDFNTGNVGIGTSADAAQNLASGFKLSVNGKIASEEILVDLSNSWPDYVFKKDYKLRTLPELENFIDDKGHLPGLPAAADVQDVGIELGEMNRVLVEKIEELTLYILEQEKRITQLEAKVNKSK